MKKAYFAVLAAVALGATLLAGESIAALHADPASGQPAAATATGDVAGPSEKEKEEALAKAEIAKKLVVARVNGTGISMYSLVRMMNQLAPQYVQPGEDIPEALSQKIEKEALDQLIFEEMAVQSSHAKGVEIASKEIDKVIKKVKESMGNEEAYRSYLQSLNLSEEQLRSQIERSRRREIITAKEIYGKVQVAEEKIKAEYEKLKKEGKLRTEDEFVIQEILLMGGKNDEETSQRAAELLAEVKKNKGDFGRLVLDGTFITRRMQIKKAKYPTIYEKMQKMKIDELSEVVQDGGTYHIFKVVKKDAAHELSIDEARGFVENRLRVPAQEERKAAWEKELRKNAKIEILLDQVDEQLKKKAEV